MAVTARAFRLFGLIFEAIRWTFKMVACAVYHLLPKLGILMRTLLPFIPPALHATRNGLVFLKDCAFSAWQWTRAKARRMYRTKVVAADAGSSPVVAFQLDDAFFETVYETVVKHDTMLKKMVTDELDVETDFDGAILLMDRNAEHFPTILNFMRDGATTPLPEDHQALNEILAEAEHYNFQMLIDVCKAKLAQVEAELVAIFCRSVYTAEERALVIDSGEPLIMLAFNEKDEFKAEHNHEIFFRAAAKFFDYRNTFPAFHCVLDLTPKTAPGCAFDVVCGGRLIAQVPVLEEGPNGGFSSVDFDKLLERAIMLLFAAIASKLDGGRKYVSDQKYLTSA